MAKATLLVMAAGLGSRYGGNKQIDRFGAEQKLLMQYSIENALQEGFDKVVFIVRPEHESIIRELCADALPVEVGFAYQDYTSLPAFYTLPQGRSKPYGTVHAVLCARDVIHEPFVVMNADDYYDSSVFRVLREEIDRLQSPGDAAMSAYRLCNTLSPHGAVTRGQCIIRDDYLERVIETYQISLSPTGEVTDGDGRVLDPEMAASMNVWAFHPGIFDAMQQYFEDFLRALPADALRQEYPLPAMIDTMLQNGALRVHVRTTDARWFGVTYPEDKPIVEAALAALFPKA